MLKFQRISNAKELNYINSIAVIFKFPCLDWIKSKHIHLMLTLLDGGDSQLHITSPSFIALSFWASSIIENYLWLNIIIGLSTPRMIWNRAVWTPPWIQSVEH